MESTGQTVQFAQSPLGQGRHICAFFNDSEEQFRVLRPFIKDGFDRGDRAYHLVDPKLREDHLRRLGEAGVDVQQALAAGQLEVRPWEDGPLSGGQFDPDAWLASFEEVLSSGPAAGYAQTRFVAQMQWALVDLPGVDDLIEFECRVNHVTVKYKDSVICAYDLSKFSGRVVIDAIRTHPLVLMGGLLLENPFYVPPDEFLLEVRERRSGRKTAGPGR